MCRFSKKYPFLCYVLPPAFLTFAVLAGELIHSVSPELVQYAFLAAVVGAAWIGGRGPGLITAIAAPFILDYYFFPPLYTWGISAEARPYVVPFLLAGLAAAWLSSARAEASEARAAQVRESEKFRRLMAHMPDMSWTTDQFGHMIYMSPKVENVLGFSNTEICEGGLEFLLNRTHPEDLSQLQDAAKALFAENKTFDVEFRLQRNQYPDAICDGQPDVSA